MTAEHVEVLIIGAGLSGVGAGYQLEKQLPGTTYAVLESREQLGWHLGPVPLPGRAVRLRHAHPGLPVPAVDQGPRDR